MKRVILFLAICIMATSCACESWQRDMKSMRSDFGGGLDRKVSVYDYNGNLLRTYEGKFDVEQNSTGTGVYFDDNNGKRIIVNGGIIINEEK